MSNKTDLRYLAADMQILSLQAREIWLRKFSHCRVAYIQNKTVFEGERNMLISGLTKTIALYPTQSLKEVVKMGSMPLFLLLMTKRLYFSRLLGKSLYMPKVL